MILNILLGKTVGKSKTQEAEMSVKSTIWHYKWFPLSINLDQYSLGWQLSPQCHEIYMYVVPKPNYCRRIYYYNRFWKKILKHYLLSCYLCYLNKYQPVWRNKIANEYFSTINQQHTYIYIYIWCDAFIYYIWVVSHQLWYVFSKG